MRKELFGKWLLDVAKYVTTAGVISKLFGGVKDSFLLYATSFITISILLGVGLYLGGKKNK